MAKIFILDLEGQSIENRVLNRKKCNLHFTIRDFLKFMSYEYDYFYDEPFGFLTYDEMLSTDLKDCNIILGKKENTVLGFRFQYDLEAKKCVVRVLSPSTTVDWTYALKFLKDLSKLLQCSIYSENHERYDYRTIEKYNYKCDILNGIKHLKDIFIKYKMEKVHLGTKDVITLNSNEVDQILGSHNPIENFDEIAIKCSYKINCRPEQEFYISDSEKSVVFGYYIITSGKEINLKIIPNVEPRNNQLIVEYGEVTKWFLHLCFNSPKLTEPLDYFSVLGVLPKEKIHFVTDNIIVIDKLSGIDLKIIYKKYLEKLRYEEKYITDNQNYYEYYKANLKEIDRIKRLSALTHIGFFLNFCIENNLVSDYYKKYYSMINKKYLRELLLYTFNGILSKIMLNRFGINFADFYYNSNELKEIIKLCMTMEYNESNYEIIKKKYFNKHYSQYNN
ncbi:DUF4299 family protein [uncultured Fusobacterium sp.]|uniref:DUF4299 family protein n=1 Tax=uncultured Fusobacterium sp. TaxID=159267 RepID=UPI00259532D1|nr:DUF4299 family protein [uncultured Fusobacterium sp.]